MMTLAGGCLCGACRYSLDSAATPGSYACHCLDCQTASGSAFALNAIVPEARLVVTGDLATWDGVNGSGQPTRHYFCSACKTRLYSTGTARAGIAILRMGTLDDSATLRPALHMWTRRKQPWLRLPDDAETYDEAPPLERLTSLIRNNFV